MKKVSVITTIACIILYQILINSTPANAFSFGRIEIKRTENFIAEIPVNVDGQSGLQVSIGSEKDYARFGIQRDKAVDNISLYIESIDKNRVIIKVYAIKPINQSSFNLVIRATLNGGTILEKYIVSDFPKIVSLPPPVRKEEVKSVISPYLSPQMESKVEVKKDSEIHPIEKPASPVIGETKTEEKDKLAKKIETKEKEIEPIDVIKTTEQNEKIGKDLSLIVGYTAWYNSWASAADLGDGANIKSIISDSTISSIPLISLKYKDFFISGSYFLNQQYTFPTFTDSTNKQIQYKAERKEFDVNIGYNIWKTVSLYIGWKEVLHQFKKYTENSESATIGNRYSGPIIGITGHYNLFDSGFSLYVNGSYAQWEYWGGKKDDSSTIYTSIESGASYRIKSMPLSISAGYKNQTINGKGGASGELNKQMSDVTGGILLGVSYCF